MTGSSDETEAFGMSGAAMIRSLHIRLKIASGHKLRRIFLAIPAAQADLVDLFAAQFGQRFVDHPDFRRHLERCEMVAQQGREQRRVGLRSEETTSELPSLMRISYDVFCLQKKNTPK